MFTTFSAVFAGRPGLARHVTTHAMPQPDLALAKIQEALGHAGTHLTAGTPGLMQRFFYL